MAVGRCETMRERHGGAWAVVAVVLVVAGAGWSQPFSPDAVAGVPEAVAGVKALPSLSSSLARHYLAWRDAPGELQAEGGRAGPRVAGDGAVLVWVQQAPGTTTDTIAVAALERLGGRVAGISKHFLEAWLPPEVLPEVVGRVPGVMHLRELPQMDLATVSEGVAGTGATAFTQAGFRGAGVKVAVIDLGYAGLSTAIARGEVPSNCIQVNLSSSPMESDGPHGTACAEVVHDMAPDAQLYIVKVSMSQSGFELAAEYCLAEGIDIMNCSWGFTGVNFFDGQGVLCGIVDDLSANGVLPVFAVGSRADGHNEGVITDSDGDGRHEFAAGMQACAFTAKQGAMVEPVLTWDDWPLTSQDLDLYVYDATGLNVVASSTGRQRGTQPPVESVMFAAPYTGTYYVAVDLYQAAPGGRYELFVKHNDGALQYVVRESSVICPADAAGALAVGAIHHTHYTTGPLESSSCQGPTNDGRVKPELCGPDGVSTSGYGMSFLGTSAAAPHVAGAAALLKSAHPEWSMAQVREELLARTLDLGATGPDNVYGNGPLVLADWVTITALSATPATVASGGTTQLAAEATDTLGHTLLWSWSDGGAGGVFSSASLQSPTYTAAPNSSGVNRTVTLTVTATCDGTTPVSASKSVSLTVQTASAPEHVVTVTATANPTTIALGGTTSLTITAVDSLGHTGLAYSWSDKGAGGTFASPAARTTSYTAPTTSSTQAITITATAIDKWQYPWVTGSTNLTLTVNGTVPEHTVTVTAAAIPSTVASGGTTALTASATDSLGHGIASWAWSDGEVGGTFSPSPAVQNPAYTAPANTSGAGRTVALTVTATCSGSAADNTVSGGATVMLAVESEVPHTLTVTAAASPGSVASGGTTGLTASAVDSWGHGIASWRWSDGGAGGTFSSTTVRNPTYTAAANTSGAHRTVTLTVTATCDGTTPISASRSVALKVRARK